MPIEMRNHFTLTRRPPQKTILMIAYDEQDLLEFQTYFINDFDFQSKNFLIKKFIKEKSFWPKDKKDNHDYKNDFQLFSHLTTFLQDKRIQKYIYIYTLEFI